MAAARLLMPGAKMPVSWPSTAITQGSLWLVIDATRSPSRAAMPCAYSTKRGTGSRCAQPQWACNSSGKSQWFSVRWGLMPRAIRPSTSRS